MADDKPHEIVIIRRGGHGEHEEHHGGVWKIAFADFMTAMMAFFLVMWLISANDKTRASVARYFNPVRLVDATTQPRGLHDTKKDESGVTASADTKKPADDKGEPAKNAAEGKDAKEEGKKDEAKKEGAKPKAAGKEGASASGEKEPSKDAKDAGKDGAKESPAQKEKRLESALRDNPLAALAEIAAAGPSGERAGNAAAPGKPVIGRKGGEAFRDPFAPPQPVPMRRVDTPDIDEAAADKLVAALSDPGDMPALAPKSDQPVPSDAKPSAADIDKAAETKIAADKAEQRKLDEARKAETDRKAQEEAKALVAAVSAGASDGPGPKVDVARTPEGLVLSLTDTADFSMFSTGSSVPSRQVVEMMDRVAGVLRSRSGTVVIRGFTDNKPYRGKRYDNWHLSLDRAQVAHYMLVHGGFDDARISHVEGWADRRAKPGVDPASPVNRRIEILVKDSG